MAKCKNPGLLENTHVACLCCAIWGSEYRAAPVLRLQKDQSGTHTSNAYQEVDEIVCTYDHKASLCFEPRHNKCGRCRCNQRQATLCCC